MPKSTWSLEGGYRSLFGKKYPFPAAFDIPIVFVLNQCKYNIEPICDYFQGFKVFAHKREREKGGRKRERVLNSKGYILYSISLYVIWIIPTSHSLFFLFLFS